MAQCFLLDLQRVLSKPSTCPNNAEDFSNESPFSDLSQAFLLAFYLGEPDGKFQSERNDASVSSMGPRDHQQASILPDHGGESRLQLVQLFIDDVERFLELESRCGVFNVQPFLELAFLVKDAPHFRTSISSSVDREDGQSYQERVEHIMVLNNCERRSIDIDRNSGHLRTRRNKPGFQA